MVAVPVSIKVSLTCGSGVIADSEGETLGPAHTWLEYKKVSLLRAERVRKFESPL